MRASGTTGRYPHFGGMAEAEAAAGTQKISLDADFPNFISGGFNWLLLRTFVTSLARALPGSVVAAWLDQARVTTRVAASGNLAGPRID